MSYQSSQEQVAGYWVPDCWAGEPFVQSSSSHSAEKCLSPDKKTETLNPSQSGTTPKHSTGNPGVDAWILSLRDSRALHGVKRDNKEAKQTTGIYGLIPSESFARLDQNGSCWKTSQVCLLAPTTTFHTFSETWPKQGSMFHGAVFRPKLVELPISESACGSSGNARREEALVLKRELWPTPSSRDYKSGKAGEEIFNGNSRPLSEVVGRIEGTDAYLNPDFVEWLMGWPLGWTDYRHHLYVHDEPDQDPMSYGVSSYWDEEETTRTLRRSEKLRTKRLKAIGNGQVPICMVVAWEKLSSVFLE